METSPDNITKEEGLNLLKAGQIDEAIEVLETAAKKDPEDPQIQTYLGAAYTKKGSKLRAIAAFEEAARLEETPKARYNLGQIYESLHRVDEAIRQYQMATVLDPNYAPAKNALQRIHDEYAAAHPQPEPEPVPEEPEPAEEQEATPEQPPEKGGSLSKGFSRLKGHLKSALDSKRKKE